MGSGRPSWTSKNALGIAKMKRNLTAKASSTVAGATDATNKMLMAESLLKGKEVDSSDKALLAV